MASWSDVVSQQPELAEAVRGHLDARAHKTIATLRADGSPRISGTESFFFEGELYFGSMPGSRKAQDLQADPRFALHTGSVDPPEWQGDAKVNGRAVAVEPAARDEIMAARGQTGFGDFPLFRADIDDVALIQVDEPRTKLVIELWREGQPLKRMERD